MRRVWVLLASVGLAAATALGCHHTAGVCDCEAPCHPCGSAGCGNGNGGGTITNNSSATTTNNSNGEALRVMPKATER